MTGRPPPERETRANHNLPAPPRPRRRHRRPHDLGGGRHPDDVAAAPSTSGGFTTNARPAAAQVARGATLTVRVDVTSETTRQALIDVEVYSAGGAKVFQQVWDDASFVAGRQRTYRAGWAVPVGQAVGDVPVKVGIFATGWSSLLHWNDQAATFGVVAAPPATSTTVGPTTTTTLPATTTTLPVTTTTCRRRPCP